MSHHHVDNYFYHSQSINNDFGCFIIYYFGQTIDNDKNGIVAIAFLVDRQWQTYHKIY